MPEAAIRIMCPNLRCRAVLAVPTEARGRLVRCRNCGMNIKIPQKKTDAPVAQPEPPAKGAEKKGAPDEQKAA
ncbi:MAG TPA: hypothetical protein DEB06_03345 [Phycisphaerales bacterium]|nr:hypothetical protein [Phycisphaerales bacterium]